MLLKDFYLIVDQFFVHIKTAEFVVVLMKLLIPVVLCEIQIVIYWD